MAGPFDRLLAALESSSEQAIRDSDADAVGAAVQGMILLRTRRGEFLNTTGARYSPGHAKRRAAIGLQTARVDLFMGNIGVLESIRTMTDAGQTGVRIQTGYLQGLSESRAAEIGRYLDTTGIGKSGKTYKHIGLSQREEDRIVDFIRKRVEANIRRYFK